MIATIRNSASRRATSPFQLKSTSLYDCNAVDIVAEDMTREFQLKSTSLYDCNQDAAQKLLDEMVSVEVNLSV